MRTNPLPLLLICLAPLVGCAAHTKHTETHAQEADPAMHIHYLEIVTPDVDATCDALASAHGTTFSEPIPELGNARMAPLDSGGSISVRAPMRPTETPVVRPYIMVDDLAAAVEAARAAGAQIALPAMEIPGRGTIAIYILGGIEHGLWQK